MKSPKQENSYDDIENALDESLDESFPASDPPSITPPKKIPETETSKNE